MIIETMRLWRDQLRDPSAGVNALLGQVPRDANDPEPPPVAVIEETQYVWTPGNKIPNQILAEDAPFLLISRASAEMVAAMPGSPEIPQGHDEVDLLALYVGFASAAPGQGPHLIMRDALHTMRAIRRVTEAWFGASTPEAYNARCRNDVQLVSPVRAVTLNIAEPMGGAFVGAGFVLGVAVTDRWALNISS